MLSDVEQYLRSREQLEGLDAIKALQTMPQVLLERFIKPPEPTVDETAAATAAADAAAAASTPSTTNEPRDALDLDEHNNETDLTPFSGVAQRAPEPEPEDDSSNFGNFGFFGAVTARPFGSTTASPFASAASALFDDAAPAKSSVASIFSFDDGEDSSTTPSATAAESSSSMSTAAPAEDAAPTAVVASVEWDDSTFTVAQADKLIEMLSSVALPGVSASGQLHLMAVIDTWRRAKEFRGGIDECGIRFLLSVKINAYLSKMQPKSKTSLSSADFAWAMHSESQEALIRACLPAEATWDDIRALGLCVWCTNPTVLRSVTENLAKVTFKATKNAEDCAIYYLALGKKSALQALFKATGNTRLAEFFANDFTEQRWQNAAQKNAYALLGKQRYELAAAFFLLAGDIKASVSICVKHMRDYHLPLLLIKLTQGDSRLVFLSLSLSLSLSLTQ